MAKYALKSITLTCFSNPDPQMWSRNGTTESMGDWNNMGGSFSTPPTSTSWGSNSMSVAGVGTDGAMWTRTNTGSGWGSWESLGGTFTNAPPSMTNWGNNQRAVCGVGSDRGLWMRFYSGGSWGGWQGLGGTFISSVIIISRGSGFLDLFGIGSDQQVYPTIFLCRN